MTCDDVQDPGGRSRVHGLLRAGLAQWPVPYVAMHLPTRFGATHVIACGPEDGPALVLLHAAGVSLTEWIRNVAALSRTYRTFLVDTCGEPNKSVWSAPFRSRSDVTDWMAEVLDGLKLERAALGGHSFGGWASLNFALAHPERVERLVMLAPAASFTKMSLGFFMHFLGPALFPTRAGIRRTMRWLSASERVEDERLTEQMFLAVRHFRFAMGGLFPTVFTDDELRALRVPALLLIGDHEVIYRPQRALDRAKRLIPGLQAELVQGASHLLNVEQPDFVNRRILSFLGQEALLQA